MKTLLLLLTICTFSFTQAQDWKFAFENSIGIYYVKANTSDTAWIKIVSEKIEYFPTREIQNPKIADGYELILYKFDCKSKKIGFVQSTVYSKDGTILNSFSNNHLKMEFASHNSLAERLTNVFCTQ
ncbi:MAG: hypothetical protein EOO46_20350 [Flavobacterium sp.]|nr:MAG: hypothetical protein EOO46_20350 [Flavobacterium sp.]